MTRFYDTSEAAKELGGKLSPRTLEKWRVQGCGPTFTKLGSRVVYAETDLQSWAESQRRRSTSRVST